MFEPSFRGGRSRRRRAGGKEMPYTPPLYPMPGPAHQGPEPLAGLFTGEQASKLALRGGLRSGVQCFTDKIIRSFRREMRGHAEE